MRLTFIFIFGVVLMSLFVSADRDYTVQVYEGWNLLHGFTGTWAVSPSSEVDVEDIEAVYLLRQPDQEYARVDPYPYGLEGVESQYYEWTAQWVYSRETGFLTYNAEDPLSLSDYPDGGFNLYEGWNFFGLNPGVVGVLGEEEPWISDIKGNCEIQRVLFWEAEDQEWIDVGTISDIESIELGPEVANYGLVLKVADDCKLEETNGGSLPPTLP
jgi:hypothetical protein